MRIKTIVYVISLLTLVTNLKAQQKQLTLEDFTTKNTFSPKSVDGVNSMNNGLHFSSLINGNKIIKYNYKSGEIIDTIFSLNRVKDCPIHYITAYSFSADEKRILLETNKKTIYRRSYSANFYVWDEYTETLYPVSDYGAQQVATLSPDGERIAFVRDNNIYIKTLRFGTEQQVTFDGITNEIINGIPDWVYEEEFEYNKAFEWSPDSKQLAFVKFDETKVPEYSFPIYKGLAPENKEHSLYPGEYHYKYPKAGETNATVSVHVFDLKSKSTLTMDTGENTDVYIPKITWTPDGNDLAIFRLNRFQNELDLLYANPFTGDTRTILTEKNSKYIETSFLEQFKYLEDQQHFVVLSERDNWSHLYLYKNNGFKIKQLTSGEFDVTDFYGYDPDKKIFYYQAAKSSPLNREIYALTFDGKKHWKLSSKDGTNEAIFSSGYKYYLNYYSDSKTPEIITVSDINGKSVRTIESNSELNNTLKNYKFPVHEFVTFTTSEGVELNGYLLKPSNFDSSKKHPVIMYQYSGPNSQKVVNSWKTDWHYYLAEQGYIVACFDPRGTAARGEEFRKCTYMQLGKLESEDQVEAAKWLATLPFTDEKNIAIWGWSYGGFMSALSLNKGGNVFKAGIAVAPVTNWRFYDTVYTERYMRTPQANPDGYDDNSPLNNTKGIKSKLLIMHGTADDNVHVQNTLEYTEALVQAGIDFDMQIFTNRNHFLRGGNTSHYVYKKMATFFENNLK